MTDFEELFKAHYSGLCQYAYKFVGDKDESEDIVQQFFVRMWKEWGNFEIANFASYAYRAVRNSSLNCLMHRSRHQQKGLDEAMEMWMENPILEDDEAYVYRSQVREAIQKIPLKSRRLLLLHCVRGLKYREIAELMGISVNTVKSQLAVAYRILTTELGDLFLLYLVLHWAFFSFK